MREIKFRMWDDKLKTMYTPDMEPNMWNIANIENGIIKQTKENVLMQYTGIADKNNKEIYEGDIVKVKWETYNQGKYFQTDDMYIGHGGTYIIKYKRLGFCFVDNKNRTISMKRDAELEIIGNIYENPELLK